jgi:hypothetical protein
MMSTAGTGPKFCASKRNPDFALDPAVGSPEASPEAVVVDGWVGEVTIRFDRAVEDCVELKFLVKVPRFSLYVLACRIQNPLLRD